LKNCPIFSKSGYKSGKKVTKTENPGLETRKSKIDLVSKTGLLLNPG
jgi:hypothetical protein